MHVNDVCNFDERMVPWKGFGVDVSEAKNSAEAVRLAGIDWTVCQREIIDSETGEIIPKFLANVRESDNRVLGIVNGPKNEVCQNIDAFEFTDKLLSEGEVVYESAGSLVGGKKVWLLAKLPGRDILGESFTPYLVFTNSHDGLSSVKAAVVPVREGCNNTLNLALSTADRIWSCDHRGDLQSKLLEAASTLKFTSRYLKSLEYTFRELAKIEIDQNRLERFVSLLLPIKSEEGKKKIENTKEMRNDILNRYKFAPDLSEMGNNAYRFINAVSDFSIHTDIHKNTRYFDENRFVKVISGNSLLIDKAYRIVKNAS